jgi:dihydropteroate synthase
MDIPDQGCINMENRQFPKIMGILNVTPDSFSDGGKFSSFNTALNRAIEMISEGVDYIDIGGESTRPGSLPVSTDVEIQRVIPLVEAIRKNNTSIKISIDTTKFEVAELALDAGADIINDISGLESDVRLADLAATYNGGLILMHMQKQPLTMQVNPEYHNVVEDVFNFLEAKVAIAKAAGVKEIIIDPGIGFGKTLEHNLTLLRHINNFEGLGCDILVGISRKSFLGKLLNIDVPHERDTATALLHAILLTKNINIIRVHNVKLINQLKTLYNSIYS